MTTATRKTDLTTMPPRPSWAKARPEISGRDAYWWSPTIRVSGHQLRLGSSYTRRDDGWHSDGPPTVWLEDVSGTEMSRAAARKLRDALDTLLDQADTARAR